MQIIDSKSKEQEERRRRYKYASSLLVSQEKGVSV